MMSPYECQMLMLQRASEMRQGRAASGRSASGTVSGYYLLALRRLFLPVDFGCKYSFWASIGTTDSRLVGRRLFGKVGIPPSPPSSKSHDGRGFCKNGLQNLEPQGFRGQNLDNKGLAAFFVVDACTHFRGRSAYRRGNRRRRSVQTYTQLPTPVE